MSERTHVSREDTKYGHLVSDEDFEADQDDSETASESRVQVADHHLVIDERVDEKYVAKYRWRFAIEHDDGARTVVGWTRSDIEENGTLDYAADKTWQAMPVDVKKRLADALGVSRRELEGMLDLPDHLLAGGGE
jgi:hypothetical protein